MGRVYTVSFENVAVSASQDLFEVTPADDKPLKIHSLNIHQHSDVGDAEEEFLRVKIIRGHATSGSGGAAATPRPINPDDTAAGFVAEVNNTTIASTGTPVDLYAESFNTRVGLYYTPPPEDRPAVHQGQTTLVVRLMAAPSDALSMSGTLTVEEG